MTRFRLCIAVLVIATNLTGCSKSDSTDSKTSSNDKGGSSATPATKLNGPLIAVTQEAISVDGKKVVKIQCKTIEDTWCLPKDYDKKSNRYRIGNTDKKDQAPEQFLVQPLFDKLSNVAKETKEVALRSETPFLGEAYLEVHPNTPSRILNETLFSSAMAGFSRVHVSRPVTLERKGSKWMRLSMPRRQIPTKGLKPLRIIVTIAYGHVGLSINRAYQDKFAFLGDHLRIQNRQFVVGGGGTSNFDGEKRLYEDYDLPAFYATLIKIKETAATMGFPTEQRTLHFAALDEQLPWHTMARIIDAARVRLDKDSFGDGPDALDAFLSAKALQDQVLFDRAIPSISTSERKIKPSSAALNNQTLKGMLELNDSLSKVLENKSNLPFNPLEDPFADGANKIATAATDKKAQSAEKNPSKRDNKSKSSLGFGRVTGRLDRSNDLVLRRTKRPIVIGGVAQVSGGLDRKTVQKVTRRNLGGIKWCYQDSLQRDPSLKGRLKLRFKILPNGRTASIQVTGMERDGALTECVKRKMLRWRFPVPKSGNAVKVTYPLVLKTS